MTWVDYFIIGIIGLSGLISLVRGFVREAVSLIVWVLAFGLAWSYFRELAVQLATWIETPSLRLGLAFIILLVVVLILGGLVGWMIAQLVDKSGLSGTDRLMGALFGIARGAVVVSILVLLAGLTPFPQDSWWRESQLIGHFQALAEWLLELIPADMSSSFRFLEHA